MNTKAGHRPWTVVSSLCAALVGVGCVEHGGPLLIVQNQVPNVGEGGCIIPATRGMIRQGLGTFDVALDRGYPYYMYPLVTSELAPLVENSTEPNRVVLTSFEVEIVPPTTVQVAWRDSCPPIFDFPTTGLVNPGDDVATLVEAIRPCHSELFQDLFKQGQLSSKITESVFFHARIKAKGLHGGTRVVSDPFDFPIRVCYGCLQTGFNLPEFANYNFPVIPKCSALTENPYQGNACNPAQEGLILCCSRDDAGDQLECPGVPRG